MKPFIQCSLVIGLLIFLLGVVFAGNYSFMNDSTFAYFHGKDKSYMTSNAMNALNHVSDGKKSTWKNPDTGAWGYAIPSKTTNQNGRVCRNLLMFNNAHDMTNSAAYRFCLFGRDWKIVR